MNQIELLRHVADNIEAGRDASCGLLFRGQILTLASDSNLDAFAWGAPEGYTLAPPTHTVNGFVVPAPEDVEPDLGVTFYTAATSMRDFAGLVEWSCSGYCELMLARGVIFATKLAAQQNALAMLGRDPSKGVYGVWKDVSGIAGIDKP